MKYDTLAETVPEAVQRATLILKQGWCRGQLFKGDKCCLLGALHNANCSNIIHSKIIDLLVEKVGNIPIFNDNCENAEQILNVLASLPQDA